MEIHFNENKALTQNNDLKSIWTVIFRRKKFADCKLGRTYTGGAEHSS